MFYRQIITLSLLKELGGTAKNTDFQKLLFLLNQVTISNYYDFVPYKFGCFSLTSYADRRRLIREGYLVNSALWEMKNFDFPVKKLKENDVEAIKATVSKFGAFSTRQLIKYVYNKYPYYASRSEIAHKYVNVKKIGNVVSLEHLRYSQLIATIGYEGKSCEEYLNLLLKSSIFALVDVRKNAFSRKFGFSKNQLNTHLKRLDIDYFHIPGLGIESEQRKTLSNYEDYKILFDAYAEDLPNRTIGMQELLSIAHKYKRIALTCFENDSKYCHRGTLSTFLANTQKEFAFTHI